MTFADYLERVTAKVRRDLEAMAPRDAPVELRILPTKAAVLELFHCAHIFNLGEAEDINKAGEELHDDLIEDFKDGTVPAPFNNMIVAFHRAEGWGFEWHFRLTDLAPPGTLRPDSSRNVWTTIDLSEPALNLPAFTSIATHQVHPPRDGHLVVEVMQPSIDRLARRCGITAETAGRSLSEGLRVMLLRIALVSHPSNYIVRTEPKLTPREEHHVRARGEHPVRKRPYYIVIEHDVLVDLNPATRRGEPNRIVAPHARRGHWMRLSERCKAARGQGKDKVWRCETYVGQRQFEDEKNRYLVMPGKDELQDQTQAQAARP